ncbi:hypothetical protein ACFSSC_02255 [Corynebacterium mendelii]|uniref:Ig-like domain repeat protein n=1 Tax=Corynebacterium mendelii TaxID=2765362 RepID=A0A939IX48_9CORY|nr:hypothetical protein [Corynebacterium mendelii]MBN9644105.1 hypothetical protein [Corynebacterium mendelii]
MRRKITAALSAAALATAAVIVPIQVASAKETTTEVRYPQTCFAVPDKLAPPKTNTGQSVTVKVTSTPNVQVGKYVKARLKVIPEESIVDGLPPGAKVTNNARIKADYQLPEGMKLMSASLKNTPSTNVSGLSAFTVNENGEKDENGRILRIASADNATIGNSPNASKKGTGNANYAVQRNRIFWELPELILTFQAIRTGEFSFGTRWKNGADQPNANDKAYITFNAVTDAGALIGKVFAPTYCTPREDTGSKFYEKAKHLYTWTVTEEVQKPPAQDTNVTIATTSVKAANAFNFVEATVSPSDAEGTVEFSAAGEQASDTVTDGHVKASLFFKNPGKIPLKARFIPANAEDFKPSEATATVKVGASPAEFVLAVSPTANQDTTVTASTFIGEGAEGTVTFTLEGATPVTVKVDQGNAVARIPVGKKLGSRKITAEFKAAAGSPIADGDSEGVIEVTENTSTSLTLEGPTTVVTPGKRAEFTATVTPKKGGSKDTSGTVAFTAGAVTKQVPVTNGRAIAEMIIDQPGLNPVSAEYFPDKGSGQTNTTAETTVVAAQRETPTLTPTAPANLKPFTPTPMQVVVATASGAPARGTVIARVHGRTTKAELSNGTAFVDITVTSTGETPVEVSYVPSEDSLLSPISDIVPVTATDNESGEGALNIALVEAEIPHEADADKPISIDVAVKNTETDSTDGVNGYLVVTINNKALQESGQPAKIPVINGKAGFDLTFKGGGQQPVQIDFFDGSGNSLGSQSYSINIKGGILNKSAEGTNANGGFFSRIIEFFTNLFAGGDAGSSAGSSGGDNKESGQPAAIAETDNK